MYCLYYAHKGVNLTTVNQLQTMLMLQKINSHLQNMSKIRCELKNVSVLAKIDI